jgi:hypothetical protein
MPLILGAACFGEVLKHSEKARALFDEVILCHDLPGCREAMSTIVDILPKSEKILKSIVKESGYDYKKSPERKNVGIPYMRGLIKGGVSVITKYRDIVIPKVLKKGNVNRDLIRLISKIDDLIRVGFNRQSDQKKGIYKVTALNSITLVQVIGSLSLIEYNKIALSEWERIKVMKIGGRVYNIIDIMSDEVTARVHRELSKNYRLAGFLQKHDQKITNTAERWYQSRIEYSGPEEYCNKLLLEKKISLYPENISNEIKECDEAVGYLRAGKKEPKENTYIKIDLLMRILIVIFAMIEKIKSIFSKK